MEALVDIGNETQIKMKASALVPRLYRYKFGRDMISDMTILKKAFKKAENLPADATEEEREDAQLSSLDLQLFENCAYIMAKHADPTVPDSPDAWLDELPMLSIYTILPTILRLWEFNNKTTAIPKKK